MLHVAIIYLSASLSCAHILASSVFSVPSVPSLIMCNVKSGSETYAKLVRNPS